MANLNLNLREDYTPSEGELNNLTYLTLKYTVGWVMRGVDFQVMKMMAGDIKGTKGISDFVSQVCEYAWDHISGEPDEFSPEDLYNHIKPILEEWYSNTTPKERDITD